MLLELPEELEEPDEVEEEVLELEELEELELEELEEPEVLGLFLPSMTVLPGLLLSLPE